MDLFTALQNFSHTENGALTYSTTGSRVLDLFAQGGAFRKRSDADIQKAVSEAFVENPLQTVETLIYLRDIRGGQGEKRVFQIGIQVLKDTVFKATKTFKPLFDAMVEVGCWKDIFKVFTFDEWKDYVKAKVEAVSEDKSDLMYKWLPSIGGSQNKTAEKLASYLGMTPKEYRKMLTKERAKLKLVETSMCANKWGEVDYSHIPSRAGLIYRPAFKKHDGNRYAKFIQAVLNGKDKDVKINTGTLYPYEIVEKYVAGYAWYDAKKLTVKPDLEAFWKSLPVFGDSQKNALVVADTSGSMFGRPLNVATSLAIYFAQHNKGIFHNKWVTFSRKPTFYSFTDESSLAEILYPFITLNICENTNLQAVFNLVLKAAKDSNVPQSEMPESIIIISDMEFDSCTGPKTNFEAIKEKYARAGYEMPHLVFWNVDSRHDNLPVKANEEGVTLVSGAAASTFDMVIAQESDPYNFMVKVVSQPRYEVPAKKILGL